MSIEILREHATPAAPATCAGRVILCRVPHSRFHPIVTWWENMETGGRCWGHYFTEEELPLAEKDFEERAKRGY